MRAPPTREPRAPEPPTPRNKRINGAGALCLVGVNAAVDPPRRHWTEAMATGVRKGTASLRRMRVGSRQGQATALRYRRGGGGRNGSLGSSASPPPPSPPPHQKIIPRKNATHQRGPKLEVDLRYTNLFFLASNTPPPPLGCR